MEIKQVEDNLNEELKKDFHARKEGFVQVGEKKWFYPKQYTLQAEEFKNFQVRSDDIWITGYPRSGTSLTEELLWLLSHNLDFAKAKESELSTLVKFFELTMITNDTIEEEILKQFPEEKENVEARRNNFKMLNEMERGNRRVIKTHFPFEILPEDVIKKGCKVIYVCRNPKDVCVSYYFLQSNNRHIDFRGDFQKFWRYFRDGYSFFGPYFEHVKQGFDRIGSKNFQFVFYEEFRQNMEGYIRKLSDLLEVSLSDKEMEDLKKHIDFDNFRKNMKVRIKDNNNKPVEFVRRGKVDGWRDYFTEELNKEADEWMKINCDRIGIKYPQLEN